MKINGMSVEAYEQYGDHHQPSLATVYRWASKASTHRTQKKEQGNGTAR